LNTQAERLDVSPEQRIRDLERRVLDLREANRELESFGAIALHDLLQPIQSMFGFLAMLEDGKASGPEQVREWAGHALRSLRRMHAMLESLVARSSAGASDLWLETVDCTALVTEILDDLAPTIAAVGGHVGVDPLPTVVADPVQLGELIQNLVTNALKFVAGGTRPLLYVRAARDGAVWRFAIEDNGIGIPTESLSEVFEPFRRLSHDDEYPGTGLGLYTCRRIVERHGGSIWAERIDTSGTRICFTIPDRGS
jgi:signal transduction histidine kinase